MFGFLLRPRPIRLVESERWTRSVSRERFRDAATGKEVEFDGRTWRTSEPDSSHLLDLELSTLALLPARLHLSLSAETDADAKLIVAGQECRRQEGATDGRARLHRLSWDVTGAAAARRSSHAELQIVHRSSPGRVALLDGPPSSVDAPRIEHRWSPGFFALALAFFALSGILLLELMVLAAAQLHRLSFALQFYAIPTTAVVWVLAVLGVADRVKLPVRRALRRLFGVTREHRKVTVAILLILVLALAVPVGGVVYAAVHRHRYAGLIHEALRSSDSEVLAAAFRRAPWRTEAQLLIAQRFFLSRKQEPDREQVKRILSELEPVIEASRGRRAPYYLDPGSELEAVRNPVIWYASLLPEAESHRETGLKRRALSLLQGVDDPAARLQTVLLTAELEQKDSQNVLSSLEEFESREGDDLSHLHGMQEVYDRLWQTELILANGAEDGTERREHAERALEWMKKLVEARWRGVQAGTRRWIRPPEKLLMMPLFLAIDGTGELAPVEDFLAVIDDSGVRGDIEADIIETHPRFKEAEFWLEGTVFSRTTRGEDFGQYIEKLLAEGWRY